MSHAVTVSEATAFFIIYTIYHTSLLFYLFTFSGFPFDVYYRVDFGASVAYGARFFYTFPVIVYAPKVAVALAITTRMALAYKMFGCHTSPGWGYFHCSTNFAHFSLSNNFFAAIFFATFWLPADAVS